MAYKINGHQFVSQGLNFRCMQCAFMLSGRGFHSALSNPNYIQACASGSPSAPAGTAYYRPPAPSSAPAPISPPHHYGHHFISIPGSMSYECKDCRFVCGMQTMQIASMAGGAPLPTCCKPPAPIGTTIPATRPKTVKVHVGGVICDTGEEVTTPRSVIIPRAHCTMCRRELCDALDAYSGHDPRGASRCLTCRRKSQID